MTTMNTRDDQATHDTQWLRVVAGPTLPDGHMGSDPHQPRAVGDPDTPDGQTDRDIQRNIAVGGPTSPAKGTVLPIAATPVEGPLTAKLPPSAIAGAPLVDHLLTLSAEVLDDLERVRLANENRLRQLTRTEVDADGGERGFGLTLDHPDVKRLADLVNDLKEADKRATRNLERRMKAHPLWPWVEANHGIGPKQAARLLAAIGDPYWNTLHDRPRTVSELWAYCGYRPGQKRQRGQKINWSATAKMRAFLIAESIVRGQGPLKAVYDTARVKYAEAVHTEPCPRCGPSGHPALPGSPLSAGHQHARGLRILAKHVLRELWREAGRLHGAEVDTP